MLFPNLEEIVIYNIHLSSTVFQDSFGFWTSADSKLNKIKMEYFAEGAESAKSLMTKYANSEKLERLFMRIPM